jgi:hypothetical protein
VIQRIRDQATYANVVASVALFVAIGGTSYAAITLPRNSVGAQQIKPRAVGSSELQPGSVGSRTVKNGSLNTRDLSRATRNALAGAQGPPGAPGAPAVAMRAAFNSGGGVVAGNATSLDGAGVGKRLVGFSRSLAGCVPVASVANNSGGSPVDPALGHVVATLQGDRVLVEMYNASGAPDPLPFNLIVAC